MRTIPWAVAAAAVLLMPGAAMAKPQSASAAMAAAMKTAKAQRKPILILFGASW